MKTITKTTLSLPTVYHKNLKKIALECDTTMAELICGAVQEKFFSKASSYDKTLEKPKFPFSRLEGIWQGHSTSEEEIRELKHVWEPKA